MTELETITIETRDNPDAAVIWLHGLGADGNDFVPLVEQLQLPADTGIRFIFPHAPVRPITLNQGYRMRGWYDLYGLSPDDREDEAGIREASAAIAQLCRQQVAQGIQSQRIILAGFSQGGAVALHCGLRYPEPLAGIMALSTYLCLPQQLATQISPAARNTPVFMAHGRQDDILAYDFGKHSADRLVAAGVTLEWHGYDMGHAVSPAEIADIRRWLLARLPALTT